MNNIEELLNEIELEKLSEKELWKVKSNMRNALYKLQNEYEQERYGNKDVRNELKDKILVLQNRISAVKRLLQKF
jgi:hypothetical protein